MNYNNIIAGPCSIESKEQFFNTCNQLRELGFTNIRGGVWKPRTKPGGFEGLGELALQWMKEYKVLYPQMLMFCEVANKDQLNLALSYDIDGIWIGARTTVDPFAVQEIADALSSIEYKQNLIVMVKNPVCPDIDLWEGAIQRIWKAGIDPNNVIAIHRGFKIYGQSKYRNEPIWRIPLDLKIKYPNLKIFVDPSHISGNREYIPEIVKEAINVYGFDGLIIESHFEPNNAWTDAKQQLVPCKMKEIIDEVFNDKTNSISNTKELDDYRKQIDWCDTQLLYFLGQRQEISKKIGNYKKTNNMTTFQKDRWKNLLNNIVKEGFEKYGLSEKYIEDIWEIIHENSIDIQSKEL